MLKLVRVAVTGSIACGKSSVCQFLKEFGAYVVSADEIVHQLLSSDLEIGQKVIALLGSDIVVNHQLDRSKIAKKVFYQPSLLRSLENLLHSDVMRQIERQYEIAKALPNTLFVAEIPLLFEAGLETFFDYAIVVEADHGICKERFKAKEGTEEDYEHRMARLLSPKEKIEKGDFVIHNNGTLEDMRGKTLKIYNEILEKQNNARCR